VIFKQSYPACPAHASYVIGDGQTRVAAVVEAPRYFAYDAAFE
jgi:hypothetical protein